MVCSLYTPGIEYVEPTLLSGVTLDCVSASRWGAKVSIGHHATDLPSAACLLFYSVFGFIFDSVVSCVRMGSTVRLECASVVTLDSVRDSSTPPGQSVSQLIGRLCVSVCECVYV